jgi:hypothetical protein
MEDAQKCVGENENMCGERKAAFIGRRTCMCRSLGLRRLSEAKETHIDWATRAKESFKVENTKDRAKEGGRS